MKQVISLLKGMVQKAQAVKSNRDYWDGYETALLDAISIIERHKK